MDVVVELAGMLLIKLPQLVAVVSGLIELLFPITFMFLCPCSKA